MTFLVTLFGLCLAALSAFIGILVAANGDPRAFIFFGIAAVWAGGVAWYRREAGHP
jgi:hypothetical protein